MERYRKKRYSPIDLPLNSRDMELKKIYETSNFLKQKKQSFTARVKEQTEIMYKNDKINQLNKGIEKLNETLRISAKADPLKLNKQITPIKQQSYANYLNSSNPANKVNAKTNTKIDLFKIRKSISLKKKNSHHVNISQLSSLLNYHDQAQRLMKEGKVHQALKLYKLNQDETRSKYGAALCHLSLHNYEQGYSLLVQVTKQDPNQQQAFIFAVAAARSLNVDASALCEDGLIHHPHSFQLLISMGKILQGKEEYLLAHEYYSKAIKINKKAEVLLADAKCLLRLNMLSNCLGNLAAALYCTTNDKLIFELLQERLKVHLINGSVHQAKKDYVKLFQIKGECGENAYLKGLIQLKENKKKEAALCFEKCIRAEDKPIIMTDALVQLCKMKIDQRDFYNAHYQISRSQFLNLSSSQITRLKLFTEGVVLLMKRKTMEGVKLLQKLRKQHTLDLYFNRIFYLYLAYGHFMLDQHSAVLADYREHAKYMPKDQSIIYNQQIAEGIVKVKDGQFQTALSFFCNNSPERVQCYLYKAMTEVQRTKRSNDDELSALQFMFAGLKQLDKAYDLNENNSNTLYLRALLYLYLGKANQGLQDIFKAISKSQENVAKYFFWRGLTHAALCNSKQALSDYNICINLDSNFVPVYLQKAKLLHTADPTQAKADLAALKNIEPKTDVHLHQSCLHYIQGEYAAASQCATFILDPVMKQKIMVQIAFKRNEFALATKIIQIKSDLVVCAVIQGQYFGEEDPINREQFTYFSPAQYYHYLGIKHFHLGHYEEAISDYLLAIKEKNLSDLEDGVLDEQEYQGPQTYFEELNCIYYNLVVMYLANKEIKKAYEVFVRDVLPSRQQYLDDEYTNQFTKLLILAMKGKEVEERTVFTLQLIQNSMSEISPIIQIILPQFVLRTRLTYLTPYFKQIYEEYRTKLNPRFILSLIGIEQVENKPEPPWVKRNQQDLVFTDDVVDAQIQFMTTEQEQEEESEEEEQQEDQQDSSDEKSFDPQGFKNQMKLGNALQLKLQKIINAQKNI